MKCFRFVQRSIIVTKNDIIFIKTIFSQWNENIMKHLKAYLAGAANYTDGFSAEG